MIKTRKSYFTLPNELIEKYRTREILATDVKIFAYLSSLRMHGLNGVCVSQRTIAQRCGLAENTVRTSISRLYKSGMIKNVVIRIDSGRMKKYKTSIYHLKELPNSGFFFVPRFIFNYSALPEKMFAVYLLMCRTRDFRYEKSWNSYSDIAARLGFGKGQRSEVIALVKGLTKIGLIKKNVRRMRKIFVDNVYRIAEFKEAVLNKLWKKEKRSEFSGTSFAQYSVKNTAKPIRNTILTRQDVNVNNYRQIELDYEYIFLHKRGRVRF